MFCTNCGKKLEDEAKFCDECGAKISIEEMTEIDRSVIYTNNENQQTVNTVSINSADKKKKELLIKGVIGIAVIIVIIIAVLFLPNFLKSRKYIDFVKSGYPEAYPDITYGEAFADFFTNPTWTYFVTDTGKDIVEFSGGCTYLDKEVTATFQFVLDVDNGSFTAEYFDMNDVSQSAFLTNGILMAVFEDYGKYNKILNIEDAKMELSEYIGMTEDEFLNASGYTKNEYSVYPDMDHAAVTCIDGLVNSILVNKYSSQNTFKGHSIGSNLSEWDEVVNGYSFVQSYDVEGGVRNLYVDEEITGVLALSYDSQNNVFSIAYALLDEETKEEYEKTIGASQSAYTNDELCMLASAYYEEMYGQVPPVVEVDREGEINVVIHLYEDMGGHATTWEWYTVDKNTGLGKDLSGNPIDLNNDQKDIVNDQQEYILPFSDTEYVLYADLNGFSKDDCRIARNEIYARHGRRFDDPQLQAWFDACTWYFGSINATDFDESVLNDIEKENLITIQNYEKDQGYR